MLKATLRQDGENLVLVLPTELRQRLALEPGDQYALAELEDGLKLTRVETRLERQLRLVQEVLEEQAGVLRELARR